MAALDHSGRGCRCDAHEARREQNRHSYRRLRDQPAGTPPPHKGGRIPDRSDDFAKHRDCACLGSWCPRVRVEQAIARGLTPERVMAETGCDADTYRATLRRMSLAAACP